MRLSKRGVRITKKDDVTEFDKVASKARLGTTYGGVSTQRAVVEISRTEFVPKKKQFGHEVRAELVLQSSNSFEDKHKDKRFKIMSCFFVSLQESDWDACDLTHRTLNQFQIVTHIVV